MRSSLRPPPPPPTQTKALADAVSANQIQADLGCLAATVPARASPVDFAYGEPGEALAIAAAGLESLQAFCLNCNQGTCRARVQVGYGHGAKREREKRKRARER